MQNVCFRIRKCTTASMDDFVSVHHEMGHIEYFMQYRYQPPVYRGPPNAGFHEGVADISSLSVLTPSYLQEVGLGTGSGDESK
jgi:peptidyl-dipeptidase A